MTQHELQFDKMQMCMMGGSLLLGVNWQVTKLGWGLEFILKVLRILFIR